MNCETSVAINYLYSFERRRVCNVSMWVHRDLSASVALPGWVATAHTDRCMLTKQKNINLQSRFLWFDHPAHNPLFQFLVRQTWALSQLWIVSEHGLFCFQAVRLHMRSDQNLQGVARWEKHIVTVTFKYLLPKLRGWIPEYFGPCDQHLP